jgi:lipopolysaccharide/colanic/teichoic acid biosynthesis glycosyltransferase
VTSLYLDYGKRLFDLVLTSAAFVATTPLHAACAMAIRWTSGSPVYFRQVRAGKDGIPFEIIKFRTMAPGTHELSGGYPTADMVTPIGKILRRTSLDELPQLLNVLSGRMSLVGPRPALPEQAERYDAQQWERLSVRPGVTGLAQIRYRNSAPWSVRIDADREYISRISFSLDVWLLLITIPRSLLGSQQLVGQSVDEVDDLGKTRLQVSETRGGREPLDSHGR